jgi:hypothetical protein
VRAGLGVVDHGVGGDHDAVPLTRARRPKSMSSRNRARGQAAEGVPDLAAHEPPRGADSQHVAGAVVLPLVGLAPLEPGLAPPGPGDGEPHLEQQASVVPAPHLRAEHVGRGRQVAGAQQLGERVGGRGAVVVQQPDPSHEGLVVLVLLAGLVTGRGGGRQAGGHGGAETGLARERDHAVLAEAGRQQRCRVVGAARVDAHEHVGVARGAGQRGQRRRQPPGAVVGHEHGRDVMAARDDVRLVVGLRGERGVRIVLGRGIGRRRAGLRRRGRCAPGQRGRSSWAGPL